MTPEEIIATKLLGWVACEPYPGLESRPYRWYLRCACPPELSCYIGFESDHVAFSRHDGSPWPRLHDWNDIRRMEDALAEKGILSGYIDTLLYVNYCDRKTTPERLTLIRVDWMHLIQATPEQRVQSALRVIEEAEASAAKEELASELAQQRNQAYRSSLQAKVKDLESRMRCNCDLDRWEPEATTKHSKVCRIHRTAIEAVKY